MNNYKINEIDINKDLSEDGNNSLNNLIDNL